LSFQFYKGNTTDGHVVTVYKTENGKLRYFSFADVYGDFSSIEKILENEMKRIGADTLIS